MKNLKELKVLTEEEVDTLYILQWPPGIQPDLEVFVVPVAKRKGGVLLAVPLGVIPKKELDEGAVSPEDLMVGPSKLITVPGVEEDENGMDVPSGAGITLMLVDFSLSVLPLIREYNPAQDTHEIHSFLEESPQVVPSSNPLLQQALDWMSEEVTGRVQYYSAEENAPAPVAAPLPPKKTEKAEPKKKVTNAVLADQLSELSQALPSIMQELQSLKEKQAHFEGALGSQTPPPHGLPPHKQPFPAVGQRSSLQEFAKKIGVAPKTKASPAPVIRLDTQDVPFDDDPNVPAADLQEAFDAAADPPTMTQAIFQQSQAMNALVAHLVGSQDPLTDLASSSSSSLSTKGAGRREKLQQQLASRNGDFFLQVCHQALRRIKPLEPLPTPLKDLPKKAIFSKFMEKQGGLAGQRDFALMLWLLCQIGDAMVIQDHKGAQELLALTLVTVDQAAQDGGRWDLAYLLSLQEDPPQSIYTSRSSSTNPRLRSFSPLCPQPWATTALAFVKEQDVIATRRAETAGARRTGGASQDQTEGQENPPRKTRFPKKPKKGGGDKDAA